jgi:hypothetical protein
MTLTKALKWNIGGVVMGAVVGALFHLGWHTGVTLHPLSDLLWEWGGLFAGVARYEMVGLHLGVLVVHVLIYAALGAVIAAFLRRQKQANL